MSTYDDASEPARALLASFDELQLAEMLAAASARIHRIRDLHRNEYETCSECTRNDGVPYPCPTIRALDKEQR
ncbi:hypothetical protein J7I98_23710 [Streptomyces sp. ISL-98]|uniref:hypothetical protein n=1 Tax=Streptomyces sp. ISL-98 TaxID=2819192 RepID=UPI001BE5E765|nr:hypothetical protein [Streptomyces sp. ISL-98]MBT2508838.1 hypothetical protein [Streptomyces sp. ISL-98]